jgi:Fe-S cluster assembly protein SufD
MTNLVEIAEGLKSLLPTDEGYRSEALEKFLNKGFPTKRNEDYKYTPVDQFIKKNFSTFSIPEINEAIDFGSYFYEENGHHLVFVNGRFIISASQIQEDDGIDISEVSDFREINQVTASSKDEFVALNNAFAENIAHIKGVKNKEGLPVFIYFFQNTSTQNSLVNPRIAIDTEIGAKLVVVEKNIHLKQDNVLINRLVEVNVAANASVSITKVQNYQDGIYEIDGLKVRQAKDSRFYANTFTFRGNLIRNNLNISLDDENCETHMHGLYLLNAKSHVDNNTTADHRFPNCFSNELYKGIVDEYANAVFNGRIYVRPQAQKTNAFQSNNNISLSDTATINTKPQLEIWADDVKCSHGCTVGQLDQEAIFYLKSRGLNDRKAKSMLLTAFAEESFEYVPFEFLKEELHKTIDERIG